MLHIAATIRHDIPPLLPAIQTFPLSPVAMLCVLATACSLGTANADQPADIVLTGGKIVTVDARNPHVQAVAIRGERIVASGEASEIAKSIGPNTHVIQLDGKLAVPGFIDSHGHFLDLGRSKMVLDLSTANSWSEIVGQVSAAANDLPAGEWIIGHGWHQGKWLRKPDDSVQGYPVHTTLSRQTPNHPVLLTHGTGHMCFVNARAMAMASLDQNTKPPQGGEILRFANGKPTGALRENAMDLVHRIYASQRQQRTDQQKRDELLTAVQLAANECLRHGVTSFQDAGSTFADIDLFRELAESGKLPVRLWAMISEDNEDLRNHLDEYRLLGLGNNHLTVRSIKRLVDGALGTHGAWLLEPYNDLPTSCGLETLPIEDLKATCELAIQHDFQMCVHAIGDRANREVLNVFESIFRQHPNEQDRRWRIEHAQHLHPADIPRFAQLGVIASMQTVHATSDGPFVVQRLGRERSRLGAYAWRSLLDRNATVVNGTDVPVERIDPIANIYAAVTRKMRNGELFFPEQCMTREEILRAYTLDAAHAAFEQDVKGSITPGKLADIVVLSQDIMTVPADQIPATQVVTTILGGDIVFPSGSR